MEMMMMIMIIIRQTRSRIQKLLWASLHNTVKKHKWKISYEIHLQISVPQS